MAKLFPVSFGHPAPAGPKPAQDANFSGIHHGQRSKVPTLCAYADSRHLRGTRVSIRLPS